MIISLSGLLALATFVVVAAASSRLLLAARRGAPLPMVGTRSDTIVSRTYRVAAWLPGIALVLIGALLLRVWIAVDGWPQTHRFDFSGEEIQYVEAVPEHSTMWINLLLVQASVLAALVTLFAVPMLYATFRVAGRRVSTMRLLAWSASYVALVAVIWVDPGGGISWIMD